MINKRRFFKFLIALVTIFAFSQQAHSAEPVQSQETIQLPVLQDIQKITFKFLSRDLSGNEISSTEIVSAVMGIVSRANQYQPKEVKSKRFLFDIWDVTNFRFESNITESALLIRYKTSAQVIMKTMGGSVNGSKVKSTTLDVAYPYQLTRDGEYQILTVSWPENVVLTRAENLDSFYKVAELMQDAQRLYRELSTSNALVNGRYELKGEVNSQFNDMSIYANFERILGRYESEKTKINDAKLEHIFSLKYLDMALPLYVEVYPYRNGSKAVYKVGIVYKMDAKGGMSINTADLEGIKKKIEQIVND